ncbi:MAG: translational GTPase TypA, partial [Betaproteobacteria bacterium]
MDRTAQRPLRNIAIIAHVDHGKTTLVDKLLQQAGTFQAHERITERVMDSNDIEKERGITILAKNTAVDFDGVHVNIVDTPGHADFGGEVERTLSMVDGVLLLVDAVEGPMPQTRFVTRKALALGLKPIVVVNKVDRDGARAQWVVNQTFDLFDRLGADESQLDFPVVYASALQGWASLDPASAISGGPRGTNMRPLFETVLKSVPLPVGDPTLPLQMAVAALDYSSYVGRLVIGRLRRGVIRVGMEVAVMEPNGATAVSKITGVYGFQGLNRVPMDEAYAGEIVQVTGIDEVSIGATLADKEQPEALPVHKIDEPTLNMNFQVNTSPLVGREGKFVTSRQVRDRLYKELLTNVALRVEDTAETDVFRVSGRGELHLTILIENMRREGFELAVSRPQVILKNIDGVVCEPFEMLSVDVEEANQGAAIAALNGRRGEMLDMSQDSRGRVRLDYRIPARGLIGFQTEFMTMTRGTGVLSHVFDEYAPMKGESSDRRAGALISGDDGEAVAYALWKLQERGRMFVNPGDPVYEGMVVGIHTRDNDLIINPVKEKHLTNVRSSGKDDAIVLTPPIKLTLESAVEFIADDELVEVTPKSIRIRKRYLQEHERRKQSRT